VSPWYVMCLRVSWGWVADKLLTDREGGPGNEREAATPVFSKPSPVPKRKPEQNPSLKGERRRSLPPWAVTKMRGRGLVAAPAR